MKRVFLIGYKARSGKDTAAYYLVNNHSFVKLAFADKLKSLVSDLYGFTGNQVWGDLKDEVDRRYKKTPREILQWFGEQQKSIRKDIWASYVARQIQESSAENFVISDFRFPDEFDTLKRWESQDPKNRKLVAIELRRDNRDSISGTEHISEKALDNFDSWNFVLFNNGTPENLYGSLDKLVEEHTITENIDTKDELVLST